MQEEGEPGPSCCLMSQMFALVSSCPHQLPLYCGRAVQEVEVQEEEEPARPSGKGSSKGTVRDKDKAKEQEPAKPAKAKVRAAFFFGGPALEILLLMLKKPSAQPRLSGQG